jgi:hypothetical protein
MGGFFFVAKSDHLHALPNVPPDSSHEIREAPGQFLESSALSGDSSQETRDTRERFRASQNASEDALIPENDARQPGKDARIGPAPSLHGSSKISVFSLAAASAHRLDCRQSMSPLQSILAKYRAQSQTEREKGSYFEEFIRTYFRFEASYAKNMACGTGKTFTSLKIAEEVAGKDKRVLFLVPSLNLLSQTLTEWTQESAIPLHSFAVCSDVEVGKKRNKDEDQLLGGETRIRLVA